MSVTATASSVSFDGDDVADDFPVPFRVLEDDDLLVRTTDDDGETYTTLVLDDDYTIDGSGPDDGTGTAEGVTVTLTGGPLATGTKLVVERNTDITQVTTFQPQGQYTPITLSRMSDKLTLIAQDHERRIAALEALGDLVTITELADAVLVDEELNFSGGSDIEDRFPFEVTVPGGETARAAALFVLTDDGLSPATVATVSWKPGPADKITILRIDGIAENGGDGDQTDTLPYHLKGLVFL